MLHILIIDGQGGKLGRLLTETALTRLPGAEVIAVGTNSIATSNMMKGGAHHGATGENAVVVNAARADLILGPIGIVLADSLYGEVTEKMAAAVGRSPAQKILLPVSRCGTTVVGAEDTNLTRLLEQVDALLAPYARVD